MALAASDLAQALRRGISLEALLLSVTALALTCRGAHPKMRALRFAFIQLTVKLAGGGDFR